MKKQDQHLHTATNRRNGEEMLPEQAERPHRHSPQKVQTLPTQICAHRIELEQQNEELRRSQKELEISRRQYADLFHFAPVPYFLFDNHGIIVDVNLAAARLLGLTKAFLLGHPFAAFTLDPVVFFSHLMFARGKPRGTTCETGLKTMSGNVLHVRLESTAAEEDGADSGRCRTAVIDLTERMQTEAELRRMHIKLERRVRERTTELEQDIAERVKAEAALKKSEKLVRDITASLGEGVYVLNEDCRVVFMNPEAEHLLGWTEAELRDRNMHELIHPVGPDGVRLPQDECPIYKVVGTGARFAGEDQLFVRKNGQGFPVTVVASPLFEDGKIVATVTAFRDISEWKQREKDRERLIAELQSALGTIRTLHGIIPICSQCKKIRDDRGSWKQLEAYITEHSEAQFTHGLCSECAKKLYPGMFPENAGK